LWRGRRNNRTGWRKDNN